MENNLNTKIMGLNGKMYEQIQNNPEQVRPKLIKKDVKTGTIMDGIENDLSNYTDAETTLTKENSTSNVNENNLDPKMIERLMKYQNRKPSVREYNKIGRNDPCPCGAVDENGKPKKYKNCCLSSGKYEKLTKK